MEKRGMAPLAARLREARQQRRCSITQTAAVFGAGPFFYLKWESGRRPIPAWLQPHVERWISDGDTPTAAELRQGYAAMLTTAEVA